MREKAGTFLLRKFYRTCQRSESETSVIVDRDESGNKGLQLFSGPAAEQKILYLPEMSEPVSPKITETSGSGRLRDFYDVAVTSGSARLLDRLEEHISTSGSGGGADLEWSSPASSGGRKSHAADSKWQATRLNPTTLAVRSLHTNSALRAEVQILKQRVEVDTLFGPYLSFVSGDDGQTYAYVDVADQETGGKTLFPLSRLPSHERVAAIRDLLAQEVETARSAIAAGRDNEATLASPIAASKQEEPLLSGAASTASTPTTMCPTPTDDGSERAETEMTLTRRRATGVAGWTTSDAAATTTEENIEEEVVDGVKKRAAADEEYSSRSEQDCPSHFRSGGSSTCCPPLATEVHHDEFEISPLHSYSPSSSEKYNSKVYSLYSSFPLSVASLHNYFDYFGRDVAGYFLFLRCVALWLILPGVCGVVIFLTKSAWLMDHDPIGVLTRPTFAVLTTLSCAVFIRKVEREDQKFGLHFGTSVNSGVASAKQRGSVAGEETPPAPPTRAAFPASSRFIEAPVFLEQVLDAVRDYHLLATRTFSASATARVSPITGGPPDFTASHALPYYRPLAYCFSASVTAFMLSIAFFAMTLSLNLQGYISGPNDRAASGVEKLGHNPFYFPSLASLAQPGRILDPTGQGDFLFGGYVTLLPTVLHVLVIQQLNAAYKKVAKLLTALEAHEVREDFENSLLAKRIAFEAFDCYVGFVYIAFYERDVKKLRSELMNVYVVDCARRVCLETILPLVTHRAQKLLKKKEHSLSRVRVWDWGFSWFSSSSNVSRQRRTQSQNVNRELNIQKKMEVDSQLAVQAEICFEEYEAFDDWIEMVVQIGYITLFAGAFPFGAALACCSVVVEAFSDRHKLYFLTKRVVPLAGGGGTSLQGGSCEGRRRGAQSLIPVVWVRTVKVFLWLSVFTNSLIFGFSSKQLQKFWCAFVKADDAAGDLDPLLVEDAKKSDVDGQLYGSCREAPLTEYESLWVIVLVEHVFGLTCFVLLRWLSAESAEVREAIQRRDWWLAQKGGRAEVQYL